MNKLQLYQIHVYYSGPVTCIAVEMAVSFGCSTPFVQTNKNYYLKIYWMDCQEIHIPKRTNPTDFGDQQISTILTPSK